MIALDEWQERARQWLASLEVEFGRDARAGLSQDEDLAVGRRYMAAKYAAGFSGITIPTEFGGQGLTPLHKVVFDTLEAAAAMPMGYFGVSTAMPLPLLIRYCQDKAWARERVVAALKGEEIWCQLFSEPAAGSDLAGLRTRAEQGDAGWTINGQKLWTTFAQYADYGIMIARSDPAVPKHKGLTFFWVDMKAPGVTVRPFRLANGDIQCNEVFFDDVAVADSQRFGEVGAGFRVAMETLMIERYAASDADGFGPSLAAFIELMRGLDLGGRPLLKDGRVRSAIARNHALRTGLDAIRRRAMLAMEAGMEPGPEGALNKLFSVRSRQKLSELALDLQGAAGLSYTEGGYTKADWGSSWMGAPTMRQAGGADEMLLNTIAEKILGLPQDHRPDKGVPFNAIPA
ncbi:acyl-CoA dehydrogenase family protein [Novosphingobium mangrovi (ex Huang et al. 2023)]|uniref:Acyl-CoA dehydrogenase family protein n=1 Tax=Novosphingobium mangrovi (ex Huang et al. 2023) TaxID=2976432 RepID=A0ABT2I6W8_9SPHN|nr:acyl-CoA dehydrogenase family protein [Novosphingobium mangrovi (ex Huang et al. 2023)]MCT2400541.1 acyl-CoA dehydrogenase family protein [Novosphingobium mangrovi (ex Huang et al. 2023)]